MMHRYLIHKHAQYDNFIKIFWLCFDLFKNVPRFFVITATTTQNANFKKIKNRK